MLACHDASHAAQQAGEPGCLLQAPAEQLMPGSIVQHNVPAAVQTENENPPHCHSKELHSHSLSNNALMSIDLWSLLSTYSLLQMNKLPT